MSSLLKPLEELNNVSSFGYSVAFLSEMLCFCCSVFL
uniref:Uncharacterized protein n=1 Tax=Rhizophora mucronata TaxID=61149 RepID=A0A2P2NB36_RHIMU